VIPKEWWKPFEYTPMNIDYDEEIEEYFKEEKRIRREASEARFEASLIKLGVYDEVGKNEFSDEVLVE